MRVQELIAYLYRHRFELRPKTPVSGDLVASFFSRMAFPNRRSFRRRRFTQFPATSPSVGLAHKKGVSHSALGAYNRQTSDFRLQQRYVLSCCFFHTSTRCSAYRAQHSQWRRVVQSPLSRYVCRSGGGVGRRRFWYGNRLVELRQGQKLLLTEVDIPRSP